MIRISAKALILSNIAHWIIFALGITVGITLGYAGMTIATDGTSSGATIFSQLKSSDGFVAALAAIMVLAPIPAGYIAAKIARDAKLLHGALATSLWILVCLYAAIWGPERVDGDVQMPQWLDILTSFGAPISAMLGAWLWQIRARRRPAEVAPVLGQPPRGPEFFAGPRSQPEEVVAASQPKPASSRRHYWAEAGISTFIVVVLNILLTRHERNMLLLVILSAVVLLAVYALVRKAIKKPGAFEGPGPTQAASPEQPARARIGRLLY